ncbi:MAG: Uma2 family endonuclease [Blastocatellia bacterium]
MTATAGLAFDENVDYELVNGRKEAKMAGARHGEVCARIIIELGIYLKQNKLGRIYTPDTTFQVGLNERLPDVGFVAVERLPAEGAPLSKWEIAPDLAVEVISPNDVWEKVNDKVHEYFSAGVRQVWLVTLGQREVLVYDSPTQIAVYTENDELTSETLLPGFKCRVGNLFEV